MARPNLRSRIVTGTFTLPAVAAFVALLWLVHGVLDGKFWAGLGATAVITYLLVELNNRNALLRIRSRMMGCTFLVLYSALPFLHDWDVGYIVAGSLLMSYFTLFASYGESRNSGRIFYAFAFVGLSSLFYPPYALVALAFFISMLFQLRILTVRNFWASLFGYVLPYWLVGAWHLWQGDFMVWVASLLQSWHFALPHLAELPAHVLGAFVVVAGLTFIAMMHYKNTAYNDKIKVRMFFYTIITVEVLLLLGCVFLSSDHDILLRLLALNSAPLLAHHLSLARGRGSDIWFYTSLCVIIALGIFNYFGLWSNLFNFS